jgi:hypothetical protein
MLAEAWDEVIAIKNDKNATVKDYQDALAKYLDFKQLKEN